MAQLRCQPPLHRSSSLRKLGERKKLQAPAGLEAKNCQRASYAARLAPSWPAATAARHAASAPRCSSSMRRLSASAAARYASRVASSRRRARENAARCCASCARRWACRVHGWCQLRLRPAVLNLRRAPNRACLPTGCCKPNRPPFRHRRAHVHAVTHLHLLPNALRVLLSRFVLVGVPVAAPKTAGSQGGADNHWHDTAAVGQRRAAMEPACKGQGKAEQATSMQSSQSLAAAASRSTEQHRGRAGWACSRAPLLLLLPSRQLLRQPPLHSNVNTRIV